MKANNKPLTKFLKKNGVYFALAASLILVLGVVIAGLTNRLAQSNGEDLNAQQQVENKVTGQKDTRTTTTTSTATTTASKTTKPTEAPYLYLLPLTNTVQKVFSESGPIYCETMKDWRLHLGSDFAGEIGQEVKSVTRGTVTLVQKDALWGNVVEIDHGVGVVTRYCGVKSTVRVGDKVEMGQVIGRLDTIPCECAQAPHLHLEMTVDGMPVDPVAAIALDVRYAQTVN